MGHGDDVHILLIDDDDVDVRAITRAFRKQKIANPITVAVDGIEGLATLRGQLGHPALPRPYLILLDLNMPRMNGITFLEEIRRDPELHNSIVFVLTTSVSDQDKVAAYSHHIAGYLLKQEAGDNLLGLVQMLEQFWLSIQFPPRSA